MSSSSLQDLVASQSTPGNAKFPAFEVTPEIEAEADKRIAQFPEDQKRSAVLPLLHIVQHKFGYILRRIDRMGRRQTGA